MASLMMQPYDLSQFFYTDQCAPLIMTSPTPQRPHTQGGYHVNESQLVYAQEPIPVLNNPDGNFSQKPSSSDTKKTTKDGQPAKRRGPKPDSKPALTRRQELNRQAQRTHRERKETYIKTLEEQVMHFRDAWGPMSNDRDYWKAGFYMFLENSKRNGHSIDFLPPEYPREVSSAGSISGSTSYGAAQSATNPTAVSTGYTSPPHAQQGACPPSSGGAAGGDNGSNDVGVAISTGAGAIHPHQAVATNPALNYDQIGIDFVLTYDNNSQPQHNLPHPSGPSPHYSQHHDTPYLSPPPNE